MRFFRWITSSKIILKATLVFVLLIFGLGVYLTGKGLLQNQESYLKSLADQQGYFVDQLQEQVEYMLDQGSDTADITEYLGDRVQASGKRWVFFSIGNRLVFVKNESTTKNLEDLSYWYSFIEYVEEQEDILIKYNTFDYNNKTYKLGLIYSKSAALGEDFISKHNIYTIMLNSIALIGLLSLTLGMSMSLNDLKKKLKAAEDSITERNTKIERLTERARKIENQEIPEVMDSDFQKIYDGDFLRAFLERSDDAGLFPICFLGISILMGKEYFMRDQILSYIQPIEGFLSPRYVLGEVGRGQFIAILYRTNFEQAMHLRGDIHDLWGTINDISGTKIGIGIAQVDPKKDTAIQAYDKFISDIKKARGAHTPSA